MRVPKDPAACIEKLRDLIAQAMRHHGNADDDQGYAKGQDTLARAHQLAYAWLAQNSL